MLRQQDGAPSHLRYAVRGTLDRLARAGLFTGRLVHQTSLSPWIYFSSGTLRMCVRASTG
jgi:hypothetical protein